MNQPTIQKSRSRGAGAYRQTGLTKKITVYGRRSAPTSVEEASQLPSLLKVKPMRLSKSKFMKLSERDRARDELLAKDKLSQRQQADLRMLQEQINAGEQGDIEIGAMYDSVENDWMDYNDEEIESDEEAAQELEVIEELGVPKGNSEWASRLSAEDRAWRGQISELCDVFLEYCSSRDKSLGVNLDGATDTKGQEEKRMSFPSDSKSCVQSLLSHGYLSSTPTRPIVAFSLDVLELADALQRRSPSTSIQGIAEALCDLRNVPYMRYHRVQLSSALDAYRMIGREAKSRLDKVLTHDSHGRTLKNCCALCMYTLKNEPRLKYAMMVTGDGNNSLKRCSRAATADKRQYESEYYIDPFEVDAYKNEVKSSKRKSPEDPTSGDQVDCERRWKNASADKKSQNGSKKFFHETGIFTSTCRHSFILTICDMVKSGEQAKYALATIDRLLSTYGPRLLMGYDIGCTFKGTVSRSPMLGPKAAELEFDMCVGSFHGHAHNRTCQVNNHPLNRTGAGLTDFENNEHIYSCSNLIASATRLASAYHRHQRIHLFIETWNNNMYEGQGRLLRTKYSNALKEIDSATEFLSQSSNTTKELRKFFAEEKQYLVLSKHELPEDLFMINYVEMLELLSVKQAELNTLHATAPDDYMPKVSLNKARVHLDRQRRNVLDQVMNIQNALATIEREQDIVRWTQDSPQWAEAQQLRKLRHYHNCIDTLEQLVVQRVIEMNRTGLARTGVKLRAHILKSLTKRSVAVKAALERYNKAALELNWKPPARQYTWAQISNASILADCEILRGSRRGVLKNAWAQNENRRCVEQHHRLLRAQEEVERLNIEIRRLSTAIVDQRNELTRLLDSSNGRESGEQWLLRRYAKRRLEVNSQLLKELDSIRQLPGYTGWHTTGVHISQPCPATDGDIEMEPVDPVDPDTHEAFDARGDNASVGDEFDDLEAGDDIIEQFDKWQIALDNAEDLPA